MKHMPVLLSGLFILSTIVSGCKGEYNPFGTELRRVTPEHKAVLKGVPVCTLATNEDPLSYFLGLSYDSLLVLTLNKGDYNIAIFNTNTGKLIGKYLRKGRGPQEMVSFASENQYNIINDSLFFYGYDLSAQKDFIAFNVTAAANGQDARLHVLGEFIPVSLRAIKIDDSTNLYYRLTDNKMTLDKFSKDGELLNSWNLFPDISARYFSFMSFGLGVNSNGTKAALAMTAFPELNILDLETGERKSVTYARKMDFETSYDTYRATFTYPDITHCCGTFSIDDYICFRTFYVDESDVPANSALMVFDWDGNLKYRLLITEELSRLGTLYDPVHKVIYCTTEDDVLYRYDVSEYL